MVHRLRTLSNAPLSFCSEQPVREEAEECFPRGGQEPLSALERRTLQQKAKEDVLFGKVRERDAG